MDDIKPINLDEPTPTIANNTYSLNRQENLTMEPTSRKKPLFPIMLIIAIIGGLFTGYLMAQKKLLLADSMGTAGGNLTQNPTSAGAVKVGDVFGNADEKTFRDTAEGTLQPGGIDGEGSHHIERGANKSQWVYVTSSVVDLDLFVGHRVTVWGETNSSKKAGWLMDVGRLKVLEMNAAEINNIESAE